MAVEGINENLVSTLLWRVHNISFWEPGLHGSRISSPYFQFSNMGAQILWVHLHPKVTNGNKLNLRLRFSSLSILKIPIECEWSLLDGYGSPLVTRRNQSNSFVEYLNLSDGPSHEAVFIIKKSSFLPNDILTVRLRVWNLKGNFTQSDHITAFTRFKASEESFECRIKRFSCFQLDEEMTTLLSLDFSNKPEVFNLKIALRGSSLDDSALNLEIFAKNPRGQSLTFTLSVSVDKQKATQCVNEKHIFRDFIPNQSWIVQKFASRKEILKRKSEWLCGDDLNLLCKVNSVLRDTHEGIESPYSGPEVLKADFSRNNYKAAIKDSEETRQDKQNPKCVVSTVSRGTSRTSQQSTEHTNTPQRNTDSVATLQEDLLSVYVDHTLSDFELRSGDVCFPVHKMILCARSPVFRAKFCGDMKEANSTFLDIPDVDVHTLGHMLTFLYAGTVDDLQWESAAKLYCAVDKYQVTTLKHECSFFLRSGITVANVSELLELAERHQDQELTLFVHEFIAQHYDEIMLSEEWEEFMKRSSFFAGNTMKNVYKRKLQMEGKLV